MHLTKAVSKISLHGTQFLGDPETKCWAKIFWLSVLISGLSLLTNLSLELKSEFQRKNTKIELESSHSSLEEAVFPGIVICSYNHFRLSFVLWIHGLLVDDGVFDRLLIENGKWRAMTEDELTFREMLYKAFYAGRPYPMTPKENEMLKAILKNQVFVKYFEDFANKMNVERLNATHNVTLLMAKDIIDPDYELNDPSLIRSFFMEMSDQWELEKKFLSINWHGYWEENGEKLVKYDPVIATSQGICSWLGPLSKPDDDFILSWPNGVVPGCLFNLNSNLCLSL